MVPEWGFATEGRQEDRDGQGTRLCKRVSYLRQSKTKFLGIGLVALMAFALVLARAAAADEVQQIDWSDLRPEGDPACEAAFQQSRSIEMCEGPPQDIAYQRCARETVMRSQDEVRIAGYAHPIEMEFTGISRFLLMPPLVRCHHPPAPMANQIILVESAVPIDASFDPIFVTGRLRVEPALHGLTQIQYRMDATSIEPAFIPDVNEQR